MKMGRRALQTILLAALLVVGACAPTALANEVSLAGTIELPPLESEPRGWGRDPFVPLVAEAEAPAFALKAIFFNGSRPSAIINSRIVYVGSRIDGQKVVDIGRTHVILQGESGTVRLEMASLPEFDDGGK